jgi:hypothetical protein
MRSLTLALTLAAACAAPLLAQPVPAGPEVAVDSQPQDTHDTAVAAAADGGFLALWNDTGGPVRARAFGPGDVPRGSVSELRPTAWQHAGEYSTDPLVERLSGGGYVAVWSNVLSTEIQGGLIELTATLAFRLLNADGQPAGPETVVADSVGLAAVAATLSGGFLLAWPDEPNGPLIVRRFDAQGAAVGGDVQVADRSWSASMAALPEGGFVVAWSDGDPFLNPRLHYRIYAADGTPRTPDISLQTGRLSGLGPWISADAAGRFVIAWIDQTSTLMHRVRAHRFGAGGEPLGTEIAVTPEVPVEPMRSGDVAMRPDGSFLVVWNPYDANGILARSYDADGTPQGAAFPVHTLPGAHYLPDAAATSRGWLVSWAQSHQGRLQPYVRSFVAADCGGADALCLNGNRFRATVAWQLPGTGPSFGTPIPLTGETGAFWFFTPANYELAVKVLDGRGINGHFWVFYASLTDVEFDLTVTDTITGEERTYHNPAGTMASRADTLAF